MKTISIQSHCDCYYIFIDDKEYYVSNEDPDLGVEVICKLLNDLGHSCHVEDVY